MKTRELISILEQIEIAHPDSTVQIYLESVVDDDDFDIWELEGNISLIPSILDEESPEQETWMS